MRIAGRDLRTGGDGGVEVLDEARVVLHLDGPMGAVEAVEVQPSHPAVAALVGARAGGGFRARALECLPGEDRTGSVLFQLLDDVPTAALVGGIALQHLATDDGPPRQFLLQQADICAGWARGATVMAEVDRTGRTPKVVGPVAPDLAGDDPHAWHELGDLPPHGVRRQRRLDVWRDGDAIAVDAHFRDSHVDGDGLTEVVHEYGVTASVDPATRRFSACEASARVLPWVECPEALASAGRLVGAPVDGLRSWVRRTFTGTSTCTHLNDTLRALADVPALAHALGGGGTEPDEAG